MPKLIVTGADNIPHEYLLAREMTLGRNPGNDIQIAEEKASRLHCRFRPENGKTVVEDLGSSNGTKVNGVKVQTKILDDGDTIKIGAHTIVFRDADAELVLAPAKGQGGKPPEGAQCGVFPAIDLAPLAPVPPATEKLAARNGSSAKQAAERRPFAAFNGGAARAPQSLGAARRNRVSFGSMVFTVVMVAILVGVALVLYQRRDTPALVPPLPMPERGTSALPPRPAPKPETPSPQPKLEGGKIVAHLPPKPADGESGKPPAKAAPESEAGIAAAWTKALAERDRAIASGNFPGARGAISTFLTAHPGGAPGQRAQQELAETKKLIDAALDLLFKDAEKAVADKNYRLAVQRCTRILASDPSGKFGAGARELMTRIDESTEPRFAEVAARATAQIQAGLLDRAGETLEKALDALGGTKWAEQISAQQLQVLMARSFLRRLENARIKAAEPRKPLAVTLPDRKIAGVFCGVSGLTLELRAGARSFSVPLKELTPDDLRSVLKALNLAENHVELAYLWLLLAKTTAAQAEIEQALLDPRQESAAIRLVSLLPKQQNLHVYDFSKWQHQSDWDALSGSWCTQNGRYVLESADGGDTCLRPAAVGGPFAGKNARISFDFELSKPSPGYFFAFELGSAENGAVSMIFSEKGLALNANLAGAVEEQDEWTAGPSHVDFSAKGDTLTAVVNGRKAKPLEVPGLSEFKGTIFFRVRESGCSISNVVLRNVE